MLNNNDKLEKQHDKSEKSGAKKDTPDCDFQVTNTGIALDMIAVKPSPVNNKTTWFQKSFGLIGAYSSIKKEIFINAVKQIEVGLVQVKLNEMYVNRVIGLEWDIRTIRSVLLKWSTIVTYDIIARAWPIACVVGLGPEYGAGPHLNYYGSSH